MSDIDTVRKENPRSTIFDPGTVVRLKAQGSLGYVQDPTILGKVQKIEDHGCGMIRHYVLWPGKRKAMSYWGSNLEKTHV